MRVMKYFIILLESSISYFKIQLFPFLARLGASRFILYCILRQFMSILDLFSPCHYTAQMILNLKNR